MRLTLSLLLGLFVSNAMAWTPATSKTLRTTTTLTMRRGRGKLGKEMGAGDAKGMGASTSSAKKASSSAPQNWIPLAQAASDVLPQQDNQVVLMDTNLPRLVDGLTNPTGAVSVVKYADQLYCFASSCPSCKIPLTKSKISASDNKTPTLQCNFCKATYNVKTGAKVESDSSNDGLFGGVVKSIFSSKESGPLPVYRLGEKGGKLLIALD